MRWDALVADLAAQAEALARADRDQEIVERFRIEAGGVTLPGRLAASIGSRLRVRTVSGRLLAGTLVRIGPDWLLLTDPGRESVVAARCMISIQGLSRSAAPETSRVDARLGLRSVLRALGRHRSAVNIDLADSSSVLAIIDRVGADHIDVSASPGQLSGPDALAPLALALTAIEAVRH